MHDDLAAVGLDDDAPDVDPSLLACAQLSLSTTATPQPRVVDAPQLCVDAFDMSLHAATCVDGRDRKRLERLARYLLRPPFALHALSRTDDGRVRLDIGRQGRSFTMTPHQWLAKLAALVPPPKVHLVRYGGVFASRHHLRRAVAPTPPSPMTPMPPRQLALLSPDGSPAWTGAPLGDADVGVHVTGDASRPMLCSASRASTIASASSRCSRSVVRTTSGRRGSNSGTRAQITSEPSYSSSFPCTARSKLDARARRYRSRRRCRDAGLQHGWRAKLAN